MASLTSDKFELVKPTGKDQKDQKSAAQSTTDVLLTSIVTAISSTAPAAAPAAAASTSAVAVAVAPQVDIKGVDDDRVDQFSKLRALERAEYLARCKSSGWSCPITKAYFENPWIIGDGETYEMDAVVKWRAAHPNAKQGPTGLPITCDLSCANTLVDRYLHHGTHIKCSITQEPLKQPVCFVKRAGVKDGQCYEASSLLEGLNKTWGEYHSSRAQNYGVKTCTHPLDLNRDYVLVPNRLIWPKDADLLLPKLPTRLPPCDFDQQTIVKHRLLGIFDHDGSDTKLCDNPALNSFKERFDGLNVFKNVHAHCWMMGAHNKESQFINCLFTDCTFNRICWCQIQFNSCKFERCTWVDCETKGRDKESLVNNEFVDCTIVAHKDDQNPQDMKQILVGFQPTQTKRDTALANLKSI